MYRFYRPITQHLLKPNTFQNQNIIVTGGGSGLGLKMAQFFKELGGNVSICGRDTNQLKEESEKNKFDYYAECDLKSRESIDIFYNNYQKNIGLPNVVVHNAAANFLSPTEKLSPNAWDTVIKTNLIGPIHLSTNIVNSFKSNYLIEKYEVDTNPMNCVFCFISTMYAPTGTAYTVPSAVSKAGTEAFLKSMAVEWAPYGMRFIGVRPGAIYTEGAFSRLDPQGDKKALLEKRNPLKRLGEREELANLITYLCSPYANYINGELVRIDGGDFNKISGQFNQFFD